MGYATFNGWSIIPMPTDPAPSQVQFAMSDSVGETRSPWTMQTQVQAWPGADWWELDVQLPPLTSAQIGAWRAWFAALRGKANIFAIGDRLGKTPTGTPSGAPVCVTSSTENQATANYIYTQGWTVSTNNLLLPGDYLQIGHRLHIVAGVTAINSDASGLATIEIWPSLRETASGVAVQTSNCTGLFRLADNKRQFSENVTRLFGLTFKAIEAR
jgi:hypothetical protein